MHRTCSDLPRLTQRGRRLAFWPDTDVDRSVSTPSTARLMMPALQSKIVREKQDDDDNQDYADETVTAMAVAVAGAAEAPAETAEQEDHEYDYEDEPERHERLRLLAPD